MGGVRRSMLLRSEVVGLLEVERVNRREGDAGGDLQYLVLIGVEGFQVAYGKRNDGVAVFVALADIVAGDGFLALCTVIHLVQSAEAFGMDHAKADLLRIGGGIQAGRDADKSE